MRHSVSSASTACIGPRLVPSLGPICHMSSILKCVAQHSQVTEVRHVEKNVLTSRRAALLSLLSVSGFVALDSPSQALSAPAVSEPSSLPVSDVATAVREWDTGFIVKETGLNLGTGRMPVLFHPCMMYRWGV